MNFLHMVNITHFFQFKIKFELMNFHYFQFIYFNKIFTWDSALAYKLNYFGFLKSDLKIVIVFLVYWMDINVLSSSTSKTEDLAVSNTLDSSFVLVMTLFSSTFSVSLKLYWLFRWKLKLPNKRFFLNQKWSVKGLTFDREMSLPNGMIQFLILSKFRKDFNHW